MRVYAECIASLVLASCMTTVLFILQNPAETQAVDSGIAGKLIIISFYTVSLLLYHLQTVANCTVVVGPFVMPVCVYVWKAQQFL